MSLVFFLINFFIPVLTWVWNLLEDFEPVILFQPILPPQSWHGGRERRIDTMLEGNLEWRHTWTQMDTKMPYPESGPCPIKVSIVPSDGQCFSSASKIEVFTSFTAWSFEMPGIKLGPKQMPYHRDTRGTSGLCCGPRALQLQMAPVLEGGGIAWKFETTLSVWNRFMGKVKGLPAYTH